MQFLKTLFWVVLAVIAAVFSLKNWSPPAKIVLWSNLEAYTPLPVLLAVTFLVGFLPPFLLYRAARWQFRRKLETTERALVESRALNEPLPAAPEPVTADLPPSELPSPVQPTPTLSKSPPEGAPLPSVRPDMP